MAVESGLILNAVVLGRTTLVSPDGDDDEIGHVVDNSM